MISLSKKLKEAKSNEENNNKKLNSCESVARRRPMIRDTLLLKEIQEVKRNLPQTCKVEFPNAQELHRIELLISPDDGYWHGGVFKFIVEVPLEYNILPPKVKCLTRIWHPNISEDGDICLSLLRESSIDGLGWAPTRTIKDVVWGLNSLFTDLLNFDDPLNDEAADHFRSDRDGFKIKVIDYVQRYAKP